MRSTVKFIAIILSISLSTIAHENELMSIFEKMTPDCIQLINNIREEKGKEKVFDDSPYRILSVMLDEGVITDADGEKVNSLVDKCKSRKNIIENEDGKIDIMLNEDGNHFYDCFTAAAMKKLMQHYKKYGNTNYKIKPNVG